MFGANYHRRGWKAFFLLLALFSGVVALFLGALRWSTRKYAEVVFDEEYFFLVQDCVSETAGAVAGQVYLSGGAGYLLGDDAVVLACYFSEEDAHFVQENMAGKGVETRIVRRASDPLSLEGDRAALSEQVRANARTADSCARMLFDAANGLERAELSQEEARTAVKGVRASLKGLRAANGEGDFAAWNALLLRAERRGAEIASGILFAKDLRYLQAELCFAVSEIAEVFS